MKNNIVWLLALALFFLVSYKTSTGDNTLTKQEQEEGWVLMFDGLTTEGWRGYNQENLQDGWGVQEGTLMSVGKGSDQSGYLLYEKEQFCNFELKLDWKIGEGGNSGILYHTIDGEQYPKPYETAPEYQLIDDLGYPKKLERWQKTGADYGMHPADPDKLIIKPAGEWNSARIVFNGGHVEHWLNGEKVVEFEAWTDEWNALVSEGKWKDYPQYGLSKCGYMVLQDHGSYVWFRNIKVRHLK